MTRDLISLYDGGIRGSVAVVDDRAEFAGLASAVFAAYRREEGDLPAARDLVAKGWSNGQTLYLGEVRP